VDRIAKPHIWSDDDEKASVMDFLFDIKPNFLRISRYSDPNHESFGIAASQSRALKPALEPREKKICFESTRNLITLALTSQYAPSLFTPISVFDTLWRLQPNENIHEACYPSWIPSCRAGRSPNETSQFSEPPLNFLPQFIAYTFKFGGLYQFSLTLTSGRFFENRID
jgi:hypothetical protein